MKLESSFDNWFSLNVAGYEFPDEELGPTQDNPADDFDVSRGLIVLLSCSTPSGSWTVTGPYFTTSELASLADWFLSLINRNPSSMGIYFIERCIEMSINQPLTSLTIHLSDECLPPGSNLGDTVNIVLPLNEIDLDGAIQSLRVILTHFPGRPA